MTSERPHYHVLLIDDDPTLTTPLQEALELLAHYKVLVAHDGASGLQSLFTHRPDCVVVDILMPGLDGYQFLRAVRGDPATAEVPLVVVSALVQPEQERLGLYSGADAYLRKPVDLDELLGTIERAIHLTAGERKQRFIQLATAEQRSTDRDDKHRFTSPPKRD
jgi:DNA-binding response OmpR family regulator